MEEGDIITEQQLGRKLFVCGNWKSNGSISFVKDIVNNLLNKLEYDQQRIGNIHPECLTPIYIPKYFCRSMRGPNISASGNNKGHYER